MTQCDHPASLTSRPLNVPRRAAGIGRRCRHRGNGVRRQPVSSRSLHLGFAAAAAENLVEPSGFAYLVTRVKPAVISVRVRSNESAQTNSRNQDNDNLMPFRQGSPLDRFLQQFGFRDMPNGMQQMPRGMAGEGSGFFISPDRYAVTNNHVIRNAKTAR